jgi:hypothetical protein
MSIYKWQIIQLTFKFLVIPRAVLYLTGEAPEEEEEEFSSDDETEEDEIDVKMACYLLHNFCVSYYFTSAGLRMLTRGKVKFGRFRIVVSKQNTI